HLPDLLRDRLGRDRRDEPEARTGSREGALIGRMRARRAYCAPVRRATIWRASGRLTPQLGSSTRHLATVRSHPHVHASAFSFCNASVRFAGDSVARSIPGMLM